MAINIGDSVELVDSSVSMARGTRTSLSEGLVGTVCAKRPSGKLWAVQFETIGCRLVKPERLRPARRSGPPCSFGCR